MSRKHFAARGVTLTELVAVLAIIAVVAAILFPVYQKVNFPPNGIVRDSLGKPIPGAVLRFRNPAGQVITTITADAGGQFRRKGLDILSQSPADGYGLTMATRRTGSPNLYTFTPLGIQTALIRDEEGKPVKGLILAVGPDMHTWRGLFQPLLEFPVTDAQGVICLPRIPAGARLRFLSQDKRYVIDTVQTSVSGNAIRYTVKVYQPAKTVATL